MPVGFGFSAGDFIAALQLVSTVIDALRDSGSSSSEYRALISQLLSLETALLKVKQLEVDEEQHEEVIALRQAACQCQDTIDKFWAKIKKYQPSLRVGGNGSRVRDGWFKIKWALCKKDDLAKFKVDLMGHTESIELLLTTLHIGSARLASKKQEESSRTLTGRVQESYFGCMQKLSQVLECVSTGVQQRTRILEMTAKIIRTNINIFHIVLDIQSIISRIPAQVERQQPVYFIDALGRQTPFNLEFIMSAEAFTNVLRSNFKNIGSAADKIERGEFAIQDSSQKRDIDLTAAWETCFRPGQHVNMSMIFTSAKRLVQSCPACQEIPRDGFTEDQDIDCKKCGVTFRLLHSWIIPQLELTSRIAPDVPRLTNADKISANLNERNTRLLKREQLQDEDHEISLFQRVRARQSLILPSTSSFALSDIDVLHTSPHTLTPHTDHVSAVQINGNVGKPGANFQLGSQNYQRHNFPPMIPAAHNPPCNTLYVGNLPIDTSEDELVAMFSRQRGYKRVCFRTKQRGPMCFVEFEDVSFATKALHELYGHLLHNSVKGGIRLSFSKNPLGVRSPQGLSSLSGPPDFHPQI